jgi:hypothetical protein
LPGAAIPAESTRAISLRALFTPATAIFVCSRRAIWAVALVVLAWFPIETVRLATPTMMANSAVLDFGVHLWSR